MAVAWRRPNSIADRFLEDVVVSLRVHRRDAVNIPTAVRTDALSYLSLSLALSYEAANLECNI